MVIIRSRLLNSYPNITFGFSSKYGLKKDEPYFYNMSLSVGDDYSSVIENRQTFAKELGLTIDQIVYQKQIHSDKINFVTEKISPEGDALVTNISGLGLAVSSADCTLVFLYDPVKKVIAGIHSGWKGTYKKIVPKTVNFLKEKTGCNPVDLIAYISPAICRECYEVGVDVAELFNEKYLDDKGNGKFLLDVPHVNYDYLIKSGLKRENIEVSDLCSYEEDDLLHSYRRSGAVSGRSHGIIALKD